MAKLNFEKIVKRVIDKAPGLVVGSVVSNVVATQVTKMSNGKAAPMVVAGAQIVAGALVPAFLGGGKKAGFMEAVADGMMAQGAVQLAKALNIPGIGEADDTLSGAEEDYMNYEEASATMAGSES
ncbi:hypothetical protein IQ13_3209 [Lacibacter cauensis]|uniref:Uncharacterized protein n=1 Tax=Lacibacter cauensis TaxID=510947 RepID=A0A562SGZ2_9BACT|nr:hypothetical protein [Lacibacter cauensis]TWI80531.1 hypothetical protein IQ13_3209 [Lacibacter cauensis]